MARIVDCIYFDIEYGGIKYENISYHPFELDQKDVYRGHRINVVTASLGFEINICIKYQGDCFNYHVYRDDFEIDDIRVSNIRFTFKNSVPNEYTLPTFMSNEQESLGCGTLSAFIVGLILANVVFVYMYFWGLNDNSLFSGDDLWKTIIIMAWLCEGFWFFYFLWDYFFNVKK
ncbi:MAG: hypothetical protein IJK41_07480 [Muribaculaceae bacterium]|nr:hypothetical protein [Muribaculaceae bacterium]